MDTIATVARIEELVQGYEILTFIMDPAQLPVELQAFVNRGDSFWRVFPVGHGYELGQAFTVTLTPTG